MREDSVVLDDHDGVLRLLDGRVEMPMRDLLGHVHADEADIVLIGGTLIEGIGNWTSDFDIYVITNQRRGNFPIHEHHRTYTTKEKVSGTFDFMEDYSFTVDVYYRELQEFENLILRMKEEYQECRHRTKIFASRMPDHNKKFAHRLFDARVVQGEERFKEIFIGITREEYCYVAYRQVTCAYPEFRDIVGSWRDGDLDTCSYLARTFLRRQVLGFTHLNGNINMNDKWAVKLARRLPDRFRPLGDRFVELLNRGIAGDGQKRRLILDCLDLADDIFAASQPLLDADPAFQPCSEGREITAAERARYDRWHPELTREFAYRSRLFMSGLPPMREFLDEGPGSGLRALIERDPFRPTHLNQLDQPPAAAGEVVS
jgi:hypothetical protein